MTPMATDPTRGMRRFVLLAALFWLFPRSSNAVTWYVTQAGTGDATTIAGGLALASTHDVVLVAAGTYAEHDVQLVPSATLVSESGAALTIIDAGFLGRGVIAADQAILQGFTIRHATFDAAVDCDHVSPSILDNIIELNAGRVLRLNYSDALVRGNTLRTNPSSVSTVIAVGFSAPHIVENTIEGQDPNDNESAITLYSTSPGGAGALIEDNTIVGSLYLDSVNGPGVTEIRRNVVLGRPGSGGGGMNIARCFGPLTIHHNTFVYGFGIFTQLGSVFTLSSNIFTQLRQAITGFGGGTITLTCNDFWMNQDNYGGSPPGPTDFYADPMFCDEPNRDFHLSTKSPCAPANSPSSCGLVGALPTACSATPARRTTWGRLKVLYR